MLRSLPIVGTLVGKVFDLIPDKNERAKEAAELAKIELEGIYKSGSEQRQINLIEAGHQSIFVSGWRPALCWVCIFILAYGYFLEPWIVYFLSLRIPEHVDKIPRFDLEHVFELICVLLGVGALRSVEKVKMRKDR